MNKTSLPPAPLSLTEKQIRFERATAQFVLACQINDINVICYRYIATEAEELAHFLAGRSEIDPRVRPTNHQLRLAKDFMIINQHGEPLWDVMDYQKFGEMAESLGLKWGFRWASLRDATHVEYQEGT